MRYLVVGGAGFIGSTLVDRLLAEGQAVDVIDDLSTGSLANLADARADRSHDFTFHRLDAEEPVTADLLARRRPDVVFHLAVPVLPTEATAVATERLLAGAHAAGVGKVVVALDARFLYGPPEADEQPVREDHLGRNHTPEGRATRALVDALSEARASWDLEFTALAMATVYGPRQPAGSTIGRVVHGALARPAADGDAPTTDPGAATDLVYVDDAVDALDRAATRGNGLVVNIGSGVATSLAEVGGHARGLVDELYPDVDGRPVLVPATASGSSGLTGFAVDSSRAGMQLGWSPWTTIPDGVAAAVTWESAGFGAS